MEIWAALGTLALMIIGLLVMVGIIPIQKVGKPLGGVLVIVAIGPILIADLKARAVEFAHGNYPWWMYIFAFFVVLLFLRIISDTVFPRRRR